MTMTIAQVDGNLVITEHPVPHWLFYGCFFAGGFVALYLSAAAASDIWQTMIGTLVGLGNIAGGLLMIAREPASRVEVDPAAASIQITRWGINGKRVARYAVGEFVDALRALTHRSVGTI